MTLSIPVLDMTNSGFESTSLIPIALSLFTLWRATNDEAVSLLATFWWFVYLGWEAFYLLALHQPISALANALMCGMYGAMVALLAFRRQKKCGKAHGHNQG